MDSFRHFSRAGAILLLTLAFTIAPARAAAPEPPFTVQGGLSPDGKVAVVVFGNILWESADGDNATKVEQHVYLYDEKATKIIGPLEEIDVDGGGFGRTQENVRADWSSDGHFLAVTSREGRMNYVVVLYEIKAHGAGWRAVPQTLPKAESGPNGAAVFKNLEPGPNSGDMDVTWLSPTAFSVNHYGLRGKEGATNLSSLINSEGEIRIVYAYEDKKWIVRTYDKLPDEQSALSR